MISRREEKAHFWLIEVLLLLVSISTHFAYGVLKQLRDDNLLCQLLVSCE